MPGHSQRTAIGMQMKCKFVSGTLVEVHFETTKREYETTRDMSGQRPDWHAKNRNAWFFESRMILATEWFAILSASTAGIVYLGEHRRQRRHFF